MRIMVRLFLLGILAISMVNCTEPRVLVQHADIPNFSDIYFEGNLDLPHFSNMHSLPYVFTTGDPLDHNSILYLTESTNLASIEASHLEKILPAEEFTDWRENRCVQRNDSLICNKHYYGYDRIVTEKYVLLILNIREDFGRHYIFELRTHKHNGELIDKLVLAHWVDRNKDGLLSGRILPSMLVETFRADSILQRFQLTEQGELVEQLLGE